MAFNESISEAARLLGELDGQLDHYKAIKQTAGSLTWEQQMAEQQAIGGHLVFVATSAVEAIVEAYKTLLETQDALLAVRARVDALEAQR
jgi:hypothetical protein